jgi:hypothetical protein
MAAAVVLVLPSGAGAGTSTITGDFQGDGVLVDVYKANGTYYGELAEAATLNGCPVNRGQSLWTIYPGNDGKATVFHDDCNYLDEPATFSFKGGYVRVCVAEPKSKEPPPTSSAPTGTLPGTAGAAGCADFKQVKQGPSEEWPKTAGAYIKRIWHDTCTLPHGLTSFYVRVADVQADPVIKVRLANNGEFRPAHRKGNTYRFDVPAKKGANSVTVILKTFHDRTLKKTKTLYC